jgi:hypothetical protein
MLLLGGRMPVTKRDWSHQRVCAQSRRYGSFGARGNGWQSCCEPVPNWASGANRYVAPGRAGASRPLRKCWYKLRRLTSADGGGVEAAAHQCQCDRVERARPGEGQPLIDSPGDVHVTRARHARSELAASGEALSVPSFSILQLPPRVRQPDTAGIPAETLN